MIALSSVLAKSDLKSLIFSLILQHSNNIIMALQELADPKALSDFLITNPHSLICFSATWCGPCKASKPQLEALASSYASASDVNVNCGIIYEHVLGDDIQTYKIRAFPTYVLFAGSTEMGRVQGVNFDGIKALVTQHCTGSSFGGEGKSLGGGGAAISPADARAQRLARFGGGGNGNIPGEKKEEEKKKEVPDEEMKDASTAPAAAETTTTKSDAEDTKMDVDEPAKEKSDEGEVCAEVEMIDPTEALNKEDVETLTSSMGFSEIRAQKGLLNGNGGTVEGAVEWLLQHQDDDDIDDPIEKVPKNSAGSGGLVAQSYKCK